MDESEKILSAELDAPGEGCSEGALVLGEIAGFDLDRDMIDAEMVVQLATQSMEQIVVGMSIFRDHMG